MGGSQEKKTGRENGIIESGHVAAEYQSGITSSVMAPASAWFLLCTNGYLGALFWSQPVIAKHCEEMEEVCVYIARTIFSMAISKEVGKEQHSERRKHSKGDLLCSSPIQHPKPPQNVNVPYSCVRKGSLSDSFCFNWRVIGEIISQWASSVLDCKPFIAATMFPHPTVSKSDLYVCETLGRHDFTNCWVGM